MSSMLHIYSNIPSVISLYVEGGMRGEKKLPLDDQLVELMEQLTQRNSDHICNLRLPAHPTTIITDNVEWFSISEVSLHIWGIIQS